MIELLTTLASQDALKLLALAAALHAIVPVVRYARGWQGRGATSNGGTSSTAKLQAADMEWRTEVKDELKRHSRDLYEFGGAVRGGDHGVRNDMQKLVGEVMAQIKEWRQETREEMRALDEKLDDKRSACCEHCR